MDESRSASDPGASTSATRSFGRPSVATWLWLLALAAILVGGLAWGAYAAYEATKSYVFASLSVAIAIGISLAMALVVAIAAAVAGALHHPGVRRWLAWAAGLAVAGTLLGVVLGPALGYRYREPVLLPGAGTAELRLTGLGGDWLPTAGAVADCTTRENSDAIGTVGVFDLGALKGARVTASLGEDPATSSGSLAIDLGGESFPDGTVSPTWAGTVSLVADADGRAGTATFDLAMNDAAAQANGAGWPDRLAGSFAWRCEGTPGQQPTAEPERVGGFTIVTPGVAWEAPPAQPAATCSAGGVEGPVGVLQARSFSAALGLADARVGGLTTLWIYMDVGKGEALPSGLTFAPNWQGMVTVTALGGGGASGTVLFSDLPTGVDPGSGPAPTGWPITLSGSLSWTCGDATP